MAGPLGNVASGMFGVMSNVEKKQEEFRKRAMKIPDAIDKAVGINARTALKESIVQSDELIYITPLAPYYYRTKNLRRSNKIEKMGWAAWLVYNDADYAGYVHDGTSVMPARPWMQTALDLKGPEMIENLYNVGTLILEGGELTDTSARVDIAPGGTPGGTGP